MIYNLILKNNLSILKLELDPDPELVLELELVLSPLSFCNKNKTEHLKK